MCIISWKSCVQSPDFESRCVVIAIGILELEGCSLISRTSHMYDSTVYDREGGRGETRERVQRVVPLRELKLQTNMAISSIAVTTRAEALWTSI